MRRALILYGDGTQTLPIARSLYRLGYEVHATYSSKWSYGYGCRFITKQHYVADTHNVDSFYAFVLQLVKKVEFDIMLPMHDDSALMMARYQKELLKHTHYVMPNERIFMQGFDKHRLMSVCKEKGYPHPMTIIVGGKHLDQVSIENLHFPLLIKPNYTYGARGMTFCTDMTELKEKFPLIQQQYGDCHLQAFIPEGGCQVEVQLYIGEHGELVQSSVIKKYRWYPERGGSSCCNVSCRNDRIVEICHRLLNDIGWRGFADFDTIENPKTGELLIMELNPRVPACVKSCFASGIDWAAVIASEYVGEEHEKYEMVQEVWLRHLGFEILWCFYSKNRWKTQPSWFKFFGSKIYYQDMSCWSDPMAFIRGTIGNIVKQLSPEFRKQKQGGI